MKNIIFPEVNLDEVKGVLIDVDNTLYSFDSANMYALQKVHKLAKSVLPISFDDFYTLVRAQWTYAFDTLGCVPSAHCRHTMYQRLLEEHGVGKPFILAQKMEEAYYKNLIKAMKPDTKATAFLKECKRRQIPVCVVTDLYGNIQVQKLNRLKLSRYIDYVVANDEVGVDKPNERIFKRALEKISVLPKDAVMIGDNYEKDIKGAKALGILTYQVLFDK